MKKSLLRLTVCLVMTSIIAFGLLTSTYSLYQKSITLEGGTITIDTSHIPTEEIDYQSALAWLAAQLATPSTTAYEYFDSRSAGTSLDSTGPNWAPTINDEMNEYFGTTNAEGSWRIYKNKTNGSSNGGYNIFWTAYDISTLQSGKEIPAPVYKYVTTSDTVYIGNTKATNKIVEGQRILIINGETFDYYDTTILEELPDMMLLDLAEDETPSDYIESPSDFMINNKEVQQPDYSASDEVPSDYTKQSPSDFMQNESLPQPEEIPEVTEEENNDFNESGLLLE